MRRLRRFGGYLLQICLKKEKYYDENNQADDISNGGCPVGVFFAVTADGIEIIPGKKGYDNPKKPVDMIMI